MIDYIFNMLIYLEIPKNTLQNINGNSLMKKYKKLDKSLSQVQKWSEEIISSFEEGRKDNDDLLLYIETGEESIFALSNLGEIAIFNCANSLIHIKNGDISTSLRMMQKGVKDYVSVFITRLLTIQKLSSPLNIDIDSINRTVFTALSVGLPNLAQKFYRFMINDLETGNTVTNGHTNYMAESLRYSAMAMTIFNDLWHLPAPDLERFALPQDPVWMNYANHWREEDVEKFSEILNEVCDLHIERIGLTQKEFDSGNYEFTSPFEAVYPVEILAVLRLREQLGLQNPELTHPLLLTPYAQITSKPIDQPVEDPLLDDYLNALRKYNPELIETWDQFEV